MKKYVFIEAMDDDASDGATIYLFKFESVDSKESLEIRFSSNDEKCLFKVLGLTAKLMGQDLSDISTDDFFALAAGYETVVGEFFIEKDCSNLNTYEITKAL